MIIDKAKFYRTWAAKTPKGADRLFLGRSKIIGKPVKVLRTGKKIPEDGWRVAEVHLPGGKEKVDQPLVKVIKPDERHSDKGLEKFVPLHVLEQINPEIKFQIFEIDKDFILFEDEDFTCKLGLVVDVDAEEQALVVMLCPETEDDTAPIERVGFSSLLDKSSDPRKFETFFRNRLKKGSDHPPRSEPKPMKQRTVERRHLICYLKVLDAATNQPVGHTVNISNRGMLLTSKTPLKTEALYRLKMFLPEEIHGTRYFEFTATSRWCRRDEDPEFFNTGFHFNSVSALSIQIIDRLTQAYCF